MITYINGKYLRASDASINIKDRGLLLGDGIFETILYKNKNIFFSKLHFSRLKKSSKIFFIEFSYKESFLNKIIQNLIKKNKLENNTLSIRITITRGKSNRGIDIEFTQKPSLIITLTKIENDLTMKPLKLNIAKIRRNETSLISQNKTLNYLDNIIAKKEAQNNKFDDALFLNSKNNVCCASTSNIYYLQNGKFYTPPLNDGVLNGIIREKLIAKKKVAVKSITLNNLRNCKEIFVTNSIFGVRPVLKIGKSVYSTGQKTIEIKEFLQELGM